MRILFLTQIVPYPPIAGPKIKTWHVLRYLASKGHEIILASFVRPEEQEYLPVLREVCSQVYAVPIHRSRLVDAWSWLRSHLSDRPFLVERDDLPAMRSLVRKILSSYQVDAIHADQLSMAQFALPEPGFSPWLSRKWVPEKPETHGSFQPPDLIFDAHNATWSILDRMLSTLPRSRAVLRPLLKIETGRVKRYEGMIQRVFDHTLAVTEADQHALHEAFQAFVSRDHGFSGDGKAMSCSPCITVIPIAVDTEQRRPIQRQPDSTHILTMGTLHYPPNADGIRWFIHEIFPLVLNKCPMATLTIVGKNPPQDFLHMAERHPASLRVTGYVPDLVPYLEEAALVVVPVRAGSGMRVRILEMFAHAMPVVTTTVGLEGIDAKNEEEVLVADTSEEFASAVLRLLSDPGLQEKLARQGRRLAETKYDWKMALNKLSSIYPEKLSQR